MSKSTLLAIDTSTESCSVALKYHHEIIERFEIIPKQHAKLVLQFIDELLSSAGIVLSQLDGVAFTAGPGSFTGLRIATSVVQGIAYAADLPVVSVSTLATIAQGASRQFNTTPILVALDARMQQIYFGGYHVLKHHLVSNIIDDCLLNPDEIELPSFQTSWVAVGSGWSTYYDRLPSMLLEHIEVVEDEFYPHAGDIITLAEPRFLKGDVISARESLPLYLRETVTS